MDATPVTLGQDFGSYATQVYMYMQAPSCLMDPLPSRW